MKVKRLSAMGCLLPALLAGLAGCSPGNEGTTVLRLADWGGPAGDPVFLQTERDLRSEFERRHPGVRLAVENIPGAGQYVPKLLMTYVADNPPDVITLDASSAAAFIDHDLLVDLMPRIRTDPQFDLGAFFPNVVAIARRDAHLYAVPLDFTPMVVLFNKRLFDAAGIACPRSGWTREEFLAAALALTRARPGGKAAVPYALTFNPEMALWLPWVWAGGSDVLSPDGRQAGGYLDSPATVEILQFLVDLVRTHHVAPYLSATAAAGRDLFRAGEAAMTVSGHWSLIEYRADGMNLGVADIPGRGEAPATAMYAAGLAISRASANQDLAWEYLKYMTGAAVQQRRIAGGLAISARIDVARMCADDAVERAFLDLVPRARAPWGAQVERYARLEALGREMMADMVGGGLPVGPGAARTAILMDAELSRP